MAGRGGAEAARHAAHRSPRGGLDSLAAGESEQGTSPDQIAWAFRKTFEEAAPIVVVFDDIHSGGETFLDLVEGAALLSTGSPVLLVCIARTELIDVRPTWPVALRLEPLLTRDVTGLVGDRVPAMLRTRIVRAAGGNPLRARLSPPCA